MSVHESNLVYLDKVHEECILRNFSPSSARNYVSSCKQYLDFLGDVRLEDTGEEEIRNWIISSLREKCAPVTVNNHASGVSFMYECVLGKAVNQRTIPHQKCCRSLPQVMTRDEIKLLFSVADNPRDLATYALAYGCGLRVSEVCMVRTCDIDSKNMLLYVFHGKGNKDRYTVLPQKVLDILRDYWRKTNPSKESGWLFPSASVSGHLERGVPEKSFKRDLKRAGITRDGLHFHSLRHSFATHMLEDGATVNQAKDLLGHRSISTTSIYLHTIKNSYKALTCPIDIL